MHSDESQVCDKSSQLFNAVRTLGVEAVFVPVRKTAAIGLRQAVASGRRIEAEPVQFKE